MHMLLTLKADSKLTTAAKVDSLISAQLHDPIREPVLYNVVSLTMVHAGIENSTQRVRKAISVQNVIRKSFEKEHHHLVNVFIIDTSETRTLLVSLTANRSESRKSLSDTLSVVQTNS